MTDKGIPVTEDIIRLKANNIRDEEGVEGFKGSKGWLYNVMKRNNIAVQTKHGDSTSVSQVLINDWKDSLVKHMEGYDAKDIFNADELGLFHSLLPSKTHAVKGKKLINGKSSKIRVTILLGANMSGDEKLPVLLIGRAQNPRCFKGMKTKPLLYEWNSKAWMTGTIFEKYMKMLDNKFFKEKRQVLFFVDNCPAHPVTLQMALKNIKIIFLPKNSTSVLQPMDQGVIRSFKCKYRTKLLSHVISQVEGKDKTIEDVKVNLLMVMNWVKFAWESVTQETIKNCFKKSFFNQEIPVEEELTSSQELSLLLTSLDQNVTSNDFISFDDDLHATALVREGKSDNEDTENEDTDIESVEDESEVVVVKPSLMEAANAMDVLTRLHFYDNFVTQTEFHKFMSAFQAYQLQHKKQSTITEYFLPKNKP